MQRILCGFVLGCWVVSAPLTGWSQATMPVPDTGQTTCYNASGNIIACPSPGEPFHGQDGNYTINAPSYTDLGNGVVRDNVTGLHWEVKTSKDSVPNYDDPRDADNTYTWCDTNPATNGGNQGNCGDHDTMDFIAALNTARHGDFDDWRMPTVQELLSIADYGRYNPAINVSFFPNMVAYHYYWSSTSDVYGPAYAWVMHNGYGNDDKGNKSGGLYVLAVRGEQPSVDNRYIDNGDGTVTDTVTRLMWQQETAPVTMTWEQALAYGETSTLGGYSDWRLPSVKELLSLVDRTQLDPSISTTFIPDTAASYYWSSTSGFSDPNGAWNVSFKWGFGGIYQKSNIYYVRLVRGPHSIIVSPTSGLTTTEAGGTATFTLVLSTPPTADVTIDLSSSDPGEGTVSPTSVTFTPVDWNVPQTVTVTGVDDGTADGVMAYTIIIEPAISTDPYYNGIDPPDVSVTNTDEGVPTNTSPVFFPVRGQDGKTGIIFID